MTAVPTCPASPMTPKAAVIERAAYCYASGELPMRGDTLTTVEAMKPIHLQNHHPENDEAWIVMTVSEDMVRCKCERAPLWRQAFYASQMNLAKRKNENLANRKKRNPSLSHEEGVK